MKTILGRILLTRGFTLIELLVVVTIIGLLAGIALPVFAGVQRRSRAVVETNAAKQLVAAYLVAAQDNDGELMPGLQYNGSVTFPNGDTGGGPEAQRYPWRLAPWLKWQIDGVYLVGDVKKAVQGEDPNSTNYRYMVSLAPALGMNAYCVGGYQTTKGNRAANDVATRLVQVDSPSRLVAFASARTKTGAGSGSETGDVAGKFFVTPPIFGGTRWKTGAFDASKPSAEFGDVDFRHEGKAVTAFLDGAVRMMDPDQLRDMQLWSRQATDKDYSVRP